MKCITKRYTEEHDRHREKDQQDVYKEDDDSCLARLQFNPLDQFLKYFYHLTPVVQSKTYDANKD